MAQRQLAIATRQNPLSVRLEETGKHLGLGTRTSGPPGSP
jgi:hypothetical protein